MLAWETEEIVFFIDYVDFFTLVSANISLKQLLYSNVIVYVITLTESPQSAKQKASKQQTVKKQHAKLQTCHLSGNFVMKVKYSFVTRVDPKSFEFFVWLSFSHLALFGAVLTTFHPTIVCRHEHWIWGETLAAVFRDVLPCLKRMKPLM